MKDQNNLLITHYRIQLKLYKDKSFEELYKGFKPAYIHENPYGDSKNTHLPTIIYCNTYNRKLLDELCKEYVIDKYYKEIDMSGVEYDRDYVV